MRTPLQQLTVLCLCLSSPSFAQEVAFDVPLGGDQQVPSNASVGYGTSTFVLDRGAGTLTYSITVARLQGVETAAHLHGFAPAGGTAPVLLDLPLGKTKVGAWTIPAGAEELLLAGQVYVDVHSTGFPTGQIRGQLLRSASDATLGASLDRKQVVGFSASPATGTGAFTIDTQKNRLFIDLTVVDLLGPELGAHIHSGDVGKTGPILFMLPSGMHKTATWKYDEVDEPTILSGGTYVNVHTVSVPSGEVRGQVLPLAANPSSYCSPKLNSQGCAPTVGWTGHPTATGPDDFTLTCDQLVNQQSGLFFWGLPSAALPFSGGTLCVQGPLQRTPIAPTGGSAGPDDCSGSLAFQFDQAYLASHGLGPGLLVYGQWWALDPAQTQGAPVALSDAVQFEFRP